MGFLKRLRLTWFLLRIAVLYTNPFNWGYFRARGDKTVQTTAVRGIRFFPTLRISQGTLDTATVICLLRSSFLSYLWSSSCWIHWPICKSLQVESCESVLSNWLKKLSFGHLIYFIVASKNIPADSRSFHSSESRWVDNLCRGTEQK